MAVKTSLLLYPDNHSGLLRIPFLPSTKFGATQSQPVVSVQSLFCAVVLLLGLPSAATAQQARQYSVYHQQIIQAEELIAQQQYAAALAHLEHTFSSHDYRFLRDYQVAIQLALRL